ncbi:unnamed protein product [Xylocopa violacea]|uniref:Uncharacterized protein n=1 Tax=Xylocopa violacea TaxID=135666 RepID=A0ABP1P2E2_XYLVO
MLKGNLSPYLDTHNEEELSYVTLSNGPYVYVAESANTEPKNNHVLIDIYFLTPVLCKHCEDYVWGTGRVGVKCKVISTRRVRVYRGPPRVVPRFTFPVTGRVET